MFIKKNEKWNIVLCELWDVRVVVVETLFFCFRKASAKGIEVKSWIVL